jgi:single-strand selective monofunctional uracil DNA glycosylase
MASRNLIAIADRLATDVERLAFSDPVAYVYNPLRYARDGHVQYLERFGRSRGVVLLLGMNPGPWGMAQTGVPFGEVAAVRDWLGLRPTIDRPAGEHPKRPVLGLGCPRSEVSGRRLWGWARDMFGTPDRFFEDFFVGNYCPLQFLETSGRNLTPDRLAASEREPLFTVCDRALRDMVEVLDPRLVVGIGGFAEARARAALGAGGPTIGRILHPSPASPAANRGWDTAVAVELARLGVELP